MKKLISTDKIVHQIVARVREVAYRHHSGIRELGMSPSPDWARALWANHRLSKWEIK